MAVKSKLSILMGIKRYNMQDIFEKTELARSTINVHIRHLREKIESDPTKPHYIKTVWGVGYIFSGDKA